MVNQRFNEAQLAFISRLRDAAVPWMQVAEHQGFAVTQALIADLHTGRIDPLKGHVVVPG